MKSVVKRRERIVRVRRVQHLQAQAVVAQAEGRLASLETSSDRLQLLRESLAVGPGGLTGATYEFLDETAAVGITYYYWLEDVPLESGVTPGIYGPISAAR